MEIRTIGQFFHYFGNVREPTMRVARCIPPDKIDWTYAPAKFTLGDLLRHLAVAERYMWAENVQGRPARYTTHGKFSVPEFDDLRTQRDVFEDVSVIVSGPANLTGAKQPEHLEMVEVSPNYFSMLGVTPQMGRLFGPQDFALSFADAIVNS
jgi:hypothetical protein